MDLITLHTQIIENKLSNVYVFTGTEIGIQNIYLHQMAKVLNLPLVRADSVVSVYTACTSKSLFGNTVSLYAIRDDMDIIHHEEMYKELSNDIKQNVIVLLYEKLDSRLKFGKFFKDSTVCFEKLTPTILAKHIHETCPLNEKFTAELSNVISGSYDMAMLECDKVNQYSKSTQMDVNEAFDILMDRGVIYQPMEYDVFKFTDAFCCRRKVSVHIAKVLHDTGISSVNILGTLYNTMKNILLVQCCEDKDVSGVTGLDNRQVYFARKYLNKFATYELVSAVNLLIDVIDGIKTGKIEDKYAVSYVICKVL